MYQLLGVRANLENVLTLGLTVTPDNAIQSMAQLKSAYQKYLASIQPQLTIPAQRQLQLTADTNITNGLIELFGQQSELNDLGQNGVIEQTQVSAEVMARTKESLQTLAQIDPSIHELFTLMINYCFFAGSRRAGGGSSSGAIGCIWMNPRPTWTEQDYCEFFVHELTHNLIFLDERRFGHYPNYAILAESENFAYSAILNRSRPLDKVVHSLIVASEVLSFRLNHFDPAQRTYLHPGTETLGKSIATTIESLRQLPKSLMTERAWSLIDRVEKTWEQKPASIAQLA